MTEGSGVVHGDSTSCRKAFLTFLYRANLVSACVYAMACFFVAMHFELWLPHPGGHLPAMAATLIAFAWSLHCLQLGLAGRLSWRVALRGASWPFALSCVAAVACGFHYEQELAQPWKCTEWIYALPR